MGEGYLTLAGTSTSTSAPLKLTLEADPRQSGGARYQRQLSIRNAVTGIWLEVTNPGMRVYCGMSEVGDETLWDFVMLPTLSALLKGTGISTGTSTGAKVATLNDESCDDGCTNSPDPIVIDSDGLAHQNINMRRC
ncbi:hypothetical protein BDW75DRAFT_234188 [Aspergillus navahoensis]